MGWDSWSLYLQSTGYMPSVAVILALCFLNRQTKSQSPPQGQHTKLSQISNLNARGCKDLTINSFVACDWWGAQQNAVIIMSTSLDPLLFPFRPNLGVHDATIYMLQRVYVCLDSNSCIMRITFDFSRALNTIHLLLLREKLRKSISKQVHYHTVYWLADIQAEVCETGQCDLVQYRSSTGDCAVSIAAHLAPLRISIFLSHLSTSLNFSDFIFSGELLLHCALFHCAVGETDASETLKKN